MDCSVQRLWHLTHSRQLQTGGAYGRGLQDSTGRVAVTRQNTGDPLALGWSPSADPVVKLALCRLGSCCIFEDNCTPRNMCLLRFADVCSISELRLGQTHREQVCGHLGSMNVTKPKLLAAHDLGVRHRREAAEQRDQVVRCSRPPADRR